MTTVWAPWLNEVANKWQSEWEKAKVYEADPDKSRKKFFITAAFPYTNSPLHVGHGRTYVTADVHARLARMQGYNVLFPFAFQYTGTPIISVAEAIKRGDRDIIEDFKTIYGIPEEEVKKLSDPLFMAKYFHQSMRDTAKRIGLGVDWRREFTTVDPAFEKFVQWQYRKLDERGMIKRENSPVAYCPYDNFPVGMHDTKGDVEPEIVDLDVIFFDSGELSFMAATPRPETVFGAVAVLVNPDATYVVASMDKRKVVLSKEAYEKLKYQKELKPLREVKGSELEGLSAFNAVTGKQVPVIASKYVSPKQGTGVVMAVPAHEPEHFLALTELGKEFELIPVIRTEGLEEIPAPGIIDLAQTMNPQELKDYIDTLYNMEYHKGVMRDDIVERVRDFLKPIVREMVAGKGVPEARKAVVGILKNLGVHDVIYEISNGPIYCRCGTEIVVKLVKDQWFLDYSNPVWKASAMKALERIRVVPESAKKDLAKAVFEATSRAFTRTRGLGVRLPWDEKEIIDQLSDSTIYMVFYAVSHLLKYPPSALTDKFWDYVVLGEGDVNEVSRETGIPREELMRLREEVAYWYPLDSRHSGRDLIRNHLAYMVYHHAVLFGDDLVPREIVVNGFVRVGGKKMSKAFRNVYPLDKAIEEFGVDAVRLALLYNNDILDDVDFEPSTAKKMGEMLKKFHDFVSYLLSVKGTNAVRPADKWLSSYMNRLVSQVLKDYEGYRFKAVIDSLLFELPERIRDYLALADFPNSELLRKTISSWVRLLAPLAPHVAEEAWHLFNSSFVVKEGLPRPEDFEFDLKSFAEIEYMNYLASRIEDLMGETSGSPERIILFVSTDERKVKAMRQAVKAILARKTLRDFLLDSQGDTELYRRAYEVASKLPDSIKELIDRTELNEPEVIANNAELLVRKLGLEEVKIYDADDPATPNLKGKKDVAFPFSPGVFLVVPG